MHSSIVNNPEFLSIFYPLDQGIILWTVNIYSNSNLVIDAILFCYFSLIDLGVQQNATLFYLGIFSRREDRAD